jgi:hypothetical protein
VNTNDANQLGFIAQEVQNIYPKAVEVNKIQDKNGLIPDLLSLNTTQIDYTLYGAVKELIKKIENIKNKLIEKKLLTVIDVNASNINTFEDLIDVNTSNINTFEDLIDVNASNINTFEDLIDVNTSNINTFEDLIDVNTSNINTFEDLIDVNASNIV